MSEEIYYKVYIKNIHEEVTPTELYEIAADFGDISKYKLAQDRDGQSKGYGFIDFLTEDAANNFVEEMNCTMLKKKKLYVCRYTTRKDRQQEIATSESLPSTDPTDYSDASVYVSNLHTTVTEEMLLDTFSSCGTVVSVNICKHATSGKSLGYGYVNFQQKADANFAVDTLNFSLIGKNQISVMWSQRRSFLTKSKNSDVFVKNLHEVIDCKALYDIFRVYGNIFSCKIAQDGNGKSKGYAYIQFFEEEDAMQAIKGLNNSVVEGKHIYVAKFIPRDERLQELESLESFANVCISNLAQDFTDDDLVAMFDKYGTIKRSNIMYNEDGTSKGIGLVVFDNAEAAKAAVNKLNGRVLEGRTLHVKHQQKTFDTRQGLNIYVNNLDESLDDEDLGKLFLSYGKITSAKVMTNANGQSKGFGFVCFETYEAAMKAILSMNGCTVGSKKLYVGLAQDKRLRDSIHRARSTVQSIPNMQILTGSFIPVNPSGLTPAYMYIPCRPQMSGVYMPHMTGAYMPDMSGVNIPERKNPWQL